MTRRLPPPRAALACALLLACGSLLAACGSSHTDTVIATTPVNSDGTTTTGTTATTNTTPAVTTRTATVPAPGGTPATATTRTAPEPAFTEHESHAEGVGAAAALVRAHGYTPNNTGEYHSGQTLRVLVATRTGSGDGYGQQAFFFLGNRYLGTDAKEPSASVKVVSQGDTEVTLAYPLYRPSDPLCCPGAGQATVHFQLDNGRLQALGRIPPASSKTGVSRG